MINNNIEELSEPFKSKIKVFMAVVKIYKNNVAIFEGLRTKERQKWLVNNGKSWTMNSYHLTGRAIDLVFMNDKNKPTWIGDYKFLHYVGFFCGLTPIYSNGKLVESCHLQDDGKKIETIMKTNSDSRHTAKSQKEQELLKQVNFGFRILGFEG